LKYYLCYTNKTIETEITDLIVYSNYNHQLFKRAQRTVEIKKLCDQITAKLFANHFCPYISAWPKQTGIWITYLNSIRAVTIHKTSIKMKIVHHIQMQKNVIFILDNKSSEEYQ